MTNNYRYLNLTKEDVKTIFQKQAIEFANDSEKFAFNHFNIHNWYKFKGYDKLKPFPSLEEAEKYVEDNPAYEDEEIIQKFVLIMW